MSNRIQYAPCVECGKNGSKVRGDRIYPHLPQFHKRAFYLCECGAYCGAHAKDERPLGFPAGPETRLARKRAHEVFDPIWRENYMNRPEAYKWLAQQIGLDRMRAHIAMMTRHQANRVVAIASIKIATLRREK